MINLPSGARPLLLAAVVLGSLTAPLSAQIVAVFPKPEHARVYKKHLRPYLGRHAVVGEIRSGVLIEGPKISSSSRNELYVADPSNPAQLPYKINKQGRKVPARKRQIVEIPQDHIEGLSFYLREWNLDGLRDEAAHRNAETTRLKKARDREKRDTEAWRGKQVELLDQLQRRALWLENTLYPVAAAKVWKERERLAKMDRSRKVVDLAEGIREVSPPEKLVALAKKVPGNFEFRVVEGPHVRFTVLATMPAEETITLAHLAERIIAGFRARHVSPYVDDTFEDLIPDEIFHEFWFGPSQPERREAFYEGYFGLKWGERLEPPAPGRRARLGSEMSHLDFWNLITADREGVVAHGLAHSLAAYHFGRGGRATQPWIVEGLGLELSLDVLGRNYGPCYPRRTARYAAGHAATGSADPERDGRLGPWLDRIALDDGPPLEELSTTRYGHMKDPAAAKAWSLLRYILDHEGKQGQEWLRAACRSAGNLPRWRRAAAKIYDTEEDALQIVEDRWREHARKR